MSSLPMKQVPTGSYTYQRTYETDQDRERNKSLKPMQQRFRSWSIGEMDAGGNRTKRQHFHQDDSYKTISSGPRSNAGPHTSFDTGIVTKSPIMKRVATAESDWPSLK